MEEQIVKLPKRSEVKVEDTWRVEDIFATDELWESELIELKELIPSLSRFKGTLGSSAENLLEFFKVQESISSRVSTLYVYAHLRSDQDTANPTYQSQQSRAMSLYTDMFATISFVEPEILALDDSVINNFLNANEGLKLYELYLTNLLANRPHILDEEKEALLAEVSEVTNASSITYGMLNDADLKFPEITDEFGNRVEITHGNFISYMESTNRDVRKQAYEAVYNTYRAHKNTFASTLFANIKKDNFFAKVRNFDNARHAALFENHVPENVYDQLTSTVNENLHLMHRYLKLRKKILGVEKLHFYDIYTPLLPESKMTVTYEESVDLMRKSLGVMGEEYLDVLNEGLNERWVDIYENEGKRSGAYSSGTYSTAPYILMNWQDTVNELFTLTHEFGHSIHSYFSRKYQPYIYGDYSIFVAEVASTCNEALLNDYMLKNATSRNDKLYLINNFLEGFRGTVFRQTMFAEFEHMIHLAAQNGEALTTDKLSEMYLDLNRKYYGDEVEYDEFIAMEWARIPHFYYNYYVYQYATGYAAAQSLSAQILEHGESATTRYIDSFLKAGSSAHPLDVLKNAGVDMNSKQPIQDAMGVFEKYLTQMEELLG